MAGGELTEKLLDSEQADTGESCDCGHRASSWTGRQRRLASAKKLDPFILNYKHFCSSEAANMTSDIHLMSTNSEFFGLML